MLKLRASYLSLLISTNPWKFTVLLLIFANTLLLMDSSSILAITLAVIFLYILFKTYVVLDSYFQDVYNNRSEKLTNSLILVKQNLLSLKEINFTLKNLVALLGTLKFTSSYRGSLLKLSRLPKNTCYNTWVLKDIFSLVSRRYRLGSVNLKDKSSKENLLKY